MRKLLLLLICAIPSLASAQTAPSCSQTDVQNTINAAVNGAVVTVPGPCTAAWASVVTIPNTKGITVQASGTVTVTQNGFQLNQGALASRITGFTFTNQANCSSGTPIQTNGTSGSAFRIDHNTFTTSSPVAIQLCVSGITTGLIDHNAFTAGGASEMIHLLGGTNAWSASLIPGSSQMVFIEDNTFTNSSTTIAQAEESFNGAQFVFRHNTLTGTANDIHNGGNGGR